MSRSYKKTPRCGDKKNKAMKRYVNRRLRQKPIPADNYEEATCLQHKSYKKDVCSYEICDYEEVGTTFEEFWRGCLRSWHSWGHNYEPYPDRDKEYQNYMKWYKRK